MSSDENAIRELIASWLSASAAGDTDKVLSLMAEDVVFLLPGQPPMQGRAAFAKAQAGLGQFKLEAHSEVQEIRVLGEWAWCWTKLAIKVTPANGGASMRREGNTLSILQKQAGHWVIVRDGNMLAVVPPA